LEKSYLYASGKNIFFIADSIYQNFPLKNSDKYAFLCALCASAVKFLFIFLLKPFGCV